MVRRGDDAGSLCFRCLRLRSAGRQHRVRDVLLGRSDALTETRRLLRLLHLAHGEGGVQLRGMAATAGAGKRETRF